MSPVDYPSIQRSANEASGSAQHVFLWLNKLQLILLVLTAIVSGWGPTAPDIQRIVGIAVAITMMVALAIEIALRIGKFDDRWFRCRALAENIKSAVWYFVMSPADHTSLAEVEFLGQIEQLQERLPDLAKELSLHDDTGSLVTDWMRQTQLLPFAQKLVLYRKQRIDDQQQWYHRNAKGNVKRERIGSWAIFALEFIAIGYAFLQAWRLWEFNAVGGIAAVSASCIAWIQMKRYSDLGTSYAIAAGDIRRIAEKRQHVRTDPELQEFVREIETAVSREHSMWLAKRGN